MKFDIHVATKHESLALRQFVEHALMRKLGARAQRIRRARIRLKDVNGPRGGVDKLCHIRLEVMGGGDVTATGESPGWYEAVTMAVMNARNGLDRRIDRVRDRKTRERPEVPAVEAESKTEGAGRILG